MLRNLGGRRGETGPRMVLPLPRLALGETAGGGFLAGGALLVAIETVGLARGGFLAGGRFRRGLGQARLSLSFGLSLLFRGGGLGGPLGKAVLGLRVDFQQHLVEICAGR